MIALIAAAALISSANAAPLEREDPKDVIAAQIRAQGYACDQPQSATRDPDLSGGEDTGWILDCGDASYKVKLVPDMAATVTKVDKKKEDDQKGQDDD
jgi:hypothetical protein